jgi:ribosomal protein L16/L10AE
MEDKQELTPEQLTEARRLTELLLEKAARLRINVVPHHQVSSGKVTVWGVDQSQPVTSPGHIVFPE